MIEELDGYDEINDVTRYNIRSLLSYFDALVKDSIELSDPLKGMDFDDLCAEILKRAKEGDPVLKARILFKVLVTKRTTKAMTMEMGKKVVIMIRELIAMQ